MSALSPRSCRVVFAAVFSLAAGTWAARLVAADDEKPTFPTRQQFLESFSKEHDEQVAQLEAEIKRLRGDKNAPMGKNRLRQLQALEKQLQLARKQQPTPPTVKFKVGSYGATKYGIGGFMKVGHIIDADNAIVFVGESQREVLLRGVPTADMSDDALFKMPEFAAVTGTQRLLTGQTLLVIEPLAEEPPKKDK
jgi:hypothetical protein